MHLERKYASRKGKYIIPTSPDIEQLMGNSPNFEILIERLREGNYGRAIEKVTPPSETARQEVKRIIDAGLDATKLPPIEGTTETFGYILPANLARTRHVVLFRDESIAVVEPVNLADHNFKPYGKQFNPSPVPEVFQEGFDKVKRKYISEGGPTGTSRTVATSDNDETSENVLAELRNALVVATQLRGIRAKTQQETAKKATAILNDFLKGGH